MKEETLPLWLGGWRRRGSVGCGWQADWSTYGVAAPARDWTACRAERFAAPGAGTDAGAWGIGGPARAGPARALAAPRRAQGMPPPLPRPSRHGWRCC